MGGYAWVTLATNDAYSLGALVLAHSLRRVGTKHELVCLVTPGVTATMREKLAAVFALVQEVNVLDSKDEANLALLARPELGITFTKLHCWRLTQYEKCVFLDADTLVIRNCDELFEREELSAAPDVGWPDCFNSGVFVYKPSQQTFASITAFAAAKGSFDGGDQGLLNMFFSDWATKDISKHLPFIYNLCSTATYSYLPAFKQFGDDVRIIHFIGITKPWLQYFDTLTGTVQPPPGSSHLQPLLQLWWNIFCEQVHPQLSPSMATSTLAPIWHAFTLPSYIPPFSEISDYSDETNRNTFSSRMPDFSEFKDPWEGYSPQTDNSTSNDKSENCYCGVKYEETAAIHRSDHSSATPFAHNQQYYHEQQHSSHTPIQTYDQHQEHTSYSEENRNQEHSVQHTDHHWQQHSEQTHYVEQHNEQWTDQKHNHEQRHHNQQQHHNEHRQSDEHHQQFHHDYHINNANNHNQHQSIQEFQSAEIRHESHAYHANDINQTSHQNADHLSHITSHNESHAQNRNQDVQDNFAPHCWRCNEKKSEQTLEAVNKQTNTRRIDFPSPSPAPCTDLHNVAMRSDPNVTEHLDNANTGIAGALAQMTLGEARSAEQIALEEHMRKQSWEQGQIDYMGRDSFDNIWKKICETLSFAPQQQSTSPKEDTPSETTVKETALKKTPEKPADVKVDISAVEAEKDSTQSLICEISQEKLSTTQTEQKTPVLTSEKDIVGEAVTTKASSEPIQDVCTRAETKPKAVESCETSAEIPQLLSESLPAEQCELPSLLVCKMPVQEAPTQVPKIDSIVSTPTEAKSETTTLTAQAITQPTAPISLDSPQDIAVTSKTLIEDTTKRAIESTPDVTQPLTIDPGEQHAEMLLAASEISTVSPVPIQVAESVLQAEPKESILGAATVVSDQAIATTVTAVHESTDIASAPAPIESVQLNGSACKIERRSDAILVPSLPEKTDFSTEATKEPASDLVTTKEIPPVTEEKIATNSDAVSLEKSIKESEQTAKTETAKAKPVEQIEIEMAELKLSEQTKAVTEKSVEQAEKATSIEAEVPEAARSSSSSEEVPESPITKQSSLLEGPIDAKPLNVPSTPTVIEATPPTSPSAESVQETEEAKKSLKKSDSTDGAEGEGADKKGTKKTVKKVTKKPKTKSEEVASSAATEGATADSSQNKVKKTVKTTKKTSTKTLETDTSVPETPPPPASSGAGGIDAPVPPKRKTKSANTKGKKPEVEE